MDPNTQVELLIAGEEPQRMTLQAFLEANDEDIDGVQASAICKRLAGGRHYQGGGGASVPWTLRTVH